MDQAKSAIHPWAYKCGITVNIFEKREYMFWKFPDYAILGVFVKFAYMLRLRLWPWAYSNDRGRFEIQRISTHFFYFSLRQAKKIWKINKMSFNIMQHTRRDIG